MTTARYWGPDGASTLLVKRELDQQTVETITLEDATSGLLSPTDLLRSTGIVCVKYDNT